MQMKENLIAKFHCSNQKKKLNKKLPTKASTNLCKDDKLLDDFYVYEI